MVEVQIFFPADFAVSLSGASDGLNYVGVCSSVCKASGAAGGWEQLGNWQGAFPLLGAPHARGPAPRPSCHGCFLGPVLL